MTLSTSFHTSQSARRSGLMSRLFTCTAPLLFKGIFAAAQTEPYPGQPATGPGGAEYVHSSVAFYDHATTADGYWLFLPATPTPDTAEVVVFLHGYGAYNPFCYGKWIKHLVAKGNIVIYPRYQKNLVWPRPDAFPENAAKGILDALSHLEAHGPIKPKLDKVAYIGHSYGGVIAAWLGCHWEKMGVPKPVSMLLCEPGTGPFKGAILDCYENLPKDLKLVTIAGEDDYVVGDFISSKVFLTATNTLEKKFLIQHRDTSDRPWVLASHSEPYCYDLDFDTGIRNYTAQKVLRVSRLDSVDFYCYWKIADALIDYTRKGTNRAFCLGDGPELTYMGQRKNGQPIKPMTIVRKEMFRVEEAITSY